MKGFSFNRKNKKKKNTKIKEGKLKEYDKLKAKNGCLILSNQMSMTYQTPYKRNPNFIQWIFLFSHRF